VLILSIYSKLHLISANKMVHINFLTIFLLFIIVLIPHLGLFLNSSNIHMDLFFWGWQMKNHSKYINLGCKNLGRKQKLSKFSCYSIIFLFSIICTYMQGFDVAPHNKANIYHTEMSAFTNSFFWSLISANFCIHQLDLFASFIIQNVTLFSWNKTNKMTV